MNWIVTDNHGNTSEVRIVISGNADNLEAALRSAEKDGWKSATVEAEYGRRVITGSWATLAHHVDGWRDKPCPCLHRETRPTPERLIIGVSHFDLDTLGGVLSLLGLRGSINPNEDIVSAAFWHAAAYIDTRGPHRIEELDRSVHSYLHAFWAWSESNRLVAPRDKSVLDVTNFFQDAEEVLSEILNGDESRLAAGQEWASNKEELEQKSFRFVFTFGGLSGIVRQSAGKFVNSLYAHDCRVYDAIIGHNTETGAITLSFERPRIRNAKEVMQSVFGPEAGGHEGIAGSPRGIEFSLEDTVKVIQELNSK